MLLRSYSDEGIVLARRNFGEADRILSVYSKNHGRVSLIAKGIRRPSSKKRGHLEVFSHIRFQATLGKGIDMMTEAETIDNFREIRKSLKKISLAYYLTETVGKITHEGEAHTNIFSLIEGSLTKLKGTNQLKKLRLDFVTKLLTTLGYWPEGKILLNPDTKLSEIIERNISSVRVGKKVLE